MLLFFVSTDGKHPIIMSGIGGVFNINDVKTSNREGFISSFYQQLYYSPDIDLRDNYLDIFSCLKKEKPEFVEELMIEYDNELEETNNEMEKAIARGKDVNTENIFLPFEGDRGLSLVLSKALLLADDDNIKDVTILSQINR